MKQLILTSILLFSFISFSQDWREDKETLKGDVKSVYYTDSTDETFIERYMKEYNRNGFMIRKYFLISDPYFGATSNTMFREFNNEGNLCLKEYFVSLKDTFGVKIFEYDSIGNTIKANGEQYFYNQNGQVTELRNDEFNSQDLYEYDQSGRKIKETCISEGFLQIKTWRYDSFGNLIEEKSEMPIAQPTLIIRLNEDGTREGEEEIQNNPNDDRNSQTTYTYNSLNQMTQEVKKYLDGRLIHDKIYEYNQEGYISAELFMNVYTTPERVRESIEYEYDTHGNWILKQSFIRGELSRKEVRKIKYH